MATRPSLLSTTPDYPVPEDLSSWLPVSHQTCAPSPFLIAEQPLLPVPESPLLTQEKTSPAVHTVLSVPQPPEDDGKGQLR